MLKIIYPPPHAHGKLSFAESGERGILEYSHFHYTIKDPIALPVV